MLKFIGRGSAFNVKEGNTSAYYINDKHLILIDCGESIFERIINMNLLDGIEKVSVIITHLNSDHVGSLSSLIYYCYYIKKFKPIILFPTKDLSTLLKLMGHKNEFRYWESYRELDKNIAVRFFQTTHIDGMDCYSILLKIDKQLIFYSGDSNDLRHYQALNFINANYIYQDISLADYEGNVHLSLKRLCESVPKEYRNKVYCMHLDCDDLIDVARLEGFNVVECER
jgi:hypothetical protein